MLKAGLMEAGDIFVVNKADRPDAAHLHQQLLAMLERRRLARLDLAHPPGEMLVCSGPQLVGSHGPIELQASAPAVRSKLDDQTPTAFFCSAANHQGIDQLVAELESLAEQRSSQWRARRAEQAHEEIRHAVFEEVRRRVSAVMGRNGDASSSLGRILSGEASMEQLVDQLMRRAVEQ
jgi:LAO/AO transport system kinase